MMKHLAASATLSCLILGSTTALAEVLPEETSVEEASLDEATLEDVSSATEAPGDGLHINAAMGLRVIPLGAKLTLDAGYRIELSDSDSLLLKDTYIEAGVAASTTPSNFWGGAYIEALPLAILKLRATAQSMSYFGTFGYLHLPTDPEQSDWSLDALDKPISSGFSTHGYQLELRATLQAKVGNIVAMVPAQFSYVSMDIDRAYYETTFDFLLEPTDQFWSIEPTLGYVFTFKEHDTWLLGGLRWQHAETVGTDLSRDMPNLFGMWKLPGALAGGEMKWVALAGYWLTHPNREGSPYFATQFATDWRF